MQLTELQRVKIQENLKVMKEEWVKKLAQGKKSYEYIDVDTVRQILTYACAGITTWDFTIKQHWVEDALDSNGKNVGIVHVLGSLTIHGVGTREQFGSKVRVSANDYRADDFKGAASDALKKCAGLFGVCEQLYSKDITNDLPAQDLRETVAPDVPIVVSNVSEFKKPEPTVKVNPNENPDLIEFDRQRKRLKIFSTDEMNVYVRDFMQSKTATNKDIHPGNLAAFNAYLSKFSSENEFVV